MISLTIVFVITKAETLSLDLHVCSRPLSSSSSSSLVTVPTFEVGVFTLLNCADCVSSVGGDIDDAIYDWSGKHVNYTMVTNDVVSKTSSTTLHSLQPNSTYMIKIRTSARAARTDRTGSLVAGVTSDAVHFRTKQPGAMYTTTHRISEYAEDVDFLENHNSATVDAFPLYLMTCSATGNCQPWNKTQFTKTDEEWDQCQTTLATLCPSERGHGFNGCVQCVDGHHDNVVAACGNYTDADMMHPGFPVHYYCGIGWPENLMYFSAITEYCVEHLPSPKSDPRWEGYADYISCNSDEVDAALNNSARDPSCICWVWDDRQMSLLPQSELDSKCSSHFPWFVKEPICNCSDSKQFPESTIITDQNPSSHYVGAMPVMLPYGYYRQPQETFPVRIPSGENLSTPKKGVCKEGQQPGTNGCTWKRSPAARVLYGPDLFKAGWDDRWIPDTLHNQSHSLYNIEKFKAATHLYDHYVTQRCCGC
eukprot:m.161768 g.161768  ORF g.161768 m.161768 type:complete len:478 (+) comp31253_c3_seq1:3430-4863(+)